ncbi:MAG: hypothetical protein HY704_01580 [Gemmatimonadetes bacterium]|nr:hypothetical protein [Gemmatimonadota bacterium]
MVPVSAAVGLFYVAVLLLVAVALGRRLHRILSVQFPSFAEDVSFAAGTGLALIAYALYLAGSFGLVSAWTAVIAVALPASLSLREMGGVVRDLVRRRARLKAYVTQMGWAWRLLVAGLLVYFLLSLISSLAPPTFSDSLRHSMAVPKYYIRAGEVGFQPVFWWNVSALSEMLFMWGMLLGSDVVPTLVSYGYAVLVCLLMLGFCRAHGSGKAGLLAVGTFVAMPVILQPMSIPKPEMPVTFYITAAVALCCYWSRNGRLAWLALCGAFAGMAAFTKLHGLPVLPILGLWVGVASVLRSGRHAGPPLGNMLVFSIMAVLFALPLYGRNWLASGDPFWPFGYGLFHGDFWNATIHARWMAWDKGVGNDLLAFLTTPWYLTVETARFADFDDVRKFVSPHFLAFVPAVFWFWRDLPQPMRGAAGWLVFALSVYYAQWVFFYTNTDYVIYVFPLLSILAGSGASLVFRRGAWLRAAGVLCFLSVFAGVIPLALLAARPFTAVVFGLEPRDSFLRSQVWYYDDIQWLNRHLPAGSKLLYLPLASYYYLDREYVVGAAYYQGFLDYAGFEQPRELLRRLVDGGFTHVVVDAGALENVREYIVLAKGQVPPGGEPFRALIEEGALLAVYSNPEARTVQSRVLGWSKASPFTIYAIRDEEGGVKAGSERNEAAGLAVRKRVSYGR